MAADLIIYALVAAGLVFWLRNILGTRHGDEQSRPNPFTSHATDNTEGGMKSGSSVPGTSSLAPTDIEVMRMDLDKTMTIANEAAEKGLVEIAKADRGFNLAKFLTGSQDAFAMIIESFASEDRDMLRNLLSESVYKSFDSVLIEREKAGHKAEVEIHAIRKSEVTNAWVQDRRAYITVRFVADETNVLRDKDSKALSGDPDMISETIDVWTFGHDIKSRSPAWLVYETCDEDADEQDHKTVPDGKE